MSKVFQIAQNTLRESVRDKVLYVIVFFSVLMMVASEGLGWVSVGEELQIVQHFSLAIVSFFGALIAVFVGTGLIYKEIDKRTIYTILSKPVHRWQFMLGKFFGLLAVLFLVVVGMGVISTLFVCYSACMTPTAEGVRWVDKVNWSLYWQAQALIFFELTVVTSLALLFSTLASPILAAIFTFCTYLIGQVTPSLIDLVQYEPPTEMVYEQTGERLSWIVAQVHPVLKVLSQCMYHVLPNLTYFHLRNRIVHGPGMNHGSFFLDGEFGQAVGYALLYATAVLLVAVLCFDRRRF